ncbi:MAG: sigma-54-dependent transcriptional regulator [Acidithiobacillus sp.]
MPSQKILIVEDEKNLRSVLAAILEAEGFSTIQTERAEEALAIMARELPVLVLTDQRLPGMSGTELLRHIKERWPEIPVLIATAYGEIEQAVQAIKAGAEHYLTKPVDEGELVAIIRQALSCRGHTILPRRQDLPRHGIIGESQGTLEILEMINLVAPAPSNVLITGESGTGKELVARGLHMASSRARAPFLAFNCGAIPLDLVESEIFGYEKGAFTGAVRSQAGKLEMVGAGTLFLDEVGDMPLAMQVKLLRTLQEREYTRLGGHQPLPLAARIIAATHVDLAKAVEAGRFREDLYYRLNVIPLHIPPLRERRGDITSLVRFFLQRVCTELGRPEVEIEAAALAAMNAYSWPGNIRQIENLVERLVVLNRTGTILAADLPNEMRITETERIPPIGGIYDLHALEREAVVSALNKTHFNQSQAAILLGISRKQLRTRMKNLGLISDHEDLQDGEKI